MVIIRTNEDVQKFSQFGYSKLNFGESGKRQVELRSSCVYFDWETTVIYGNVTGCFFGFSFCDEHQIAHQHCCRFTEVFGKLAYLLVKYDRAQIVKTWSNTKLTLIVLEHQKIYSIAEKIDNLKLSRDLNLRSQTKLKKQIFRLKQSSNLSRVKSLLGVFSSPVFRPWYWWYPL